MRPPNLYKHLNPKAFVTKKNSFPRINYPTFGEIAEFNRQIVLATGGRYGGFKEADLDFLIFKIQNSFNFADKKVALVYKAAYIIYFINHVSHTFTDGNKRTSYEAAKLLLRLNSYSLKPSIRTAEKFLLEVSQYKHSLRSILKWVKKQIRKSRQVS